MTNQFDTVIGHMEDLVREYGAEYRYPLDYNRNPSSGVHCWYVSEDGTKPSCIVGQVLHRMGVPLSVLSKYEGKRPTDPFFRMVLNNEYGITYRVLSVLTIIQMDQDLGSTWSECLNSFKNLAESQS